MTQSDVETLLPVVTPFAVPALMDQLYAIAYDQFIADAAPCAGTSFEDLAITYYIASLLSSGSGSTGVKSEKIDDYTIQFGDGGQAAEYLRSYQKIIANCNQRASTIAVSAGVTRDDTLDCLDLDATGVCTESRGEYP